MIRSSLLILAGNATARLLGVLFSIAAAGFLDAAQYGRLAYALAIITIGTVLIINAPTALTSFLALHRSDRAIQDQYFSNGVALVGAMLGLSLLLIVPISVAGGLSGWMLPALMANLVGTAVFATYRATQRGLERYAPMTNFYVLANLIQLVAVLMCGWLGIRDASLYVTIYGLSNVGSLVLMQLVAPVALRFSSAALSRGLLAALGRFSWPLLLQSAFFAVWFGADLVLLQQLRPAAESGEYAVAKTIAMVLALAPLALSSVVAPRAAQAAAAELRRVLRNALALTAAVTIPVAVVVVVLGPALSGLVFGTKYAHVAEPLPWLALGMGLYALYSVGESAWVAIGEAKADALATGVGMVCTVALGLALAPTLGLSGAALAFAAGAASQLVVLSLLVVATLARGGPRGLSRGGPPIPAPQPGPADEPTAVKS